METDKEWGGSGIQDYGFRLYNPAIAKFLSVDPLAPSYPFYTPYQFAGNMPIGAIDLDGLEPWITTLEDEHNRDVGVTRIKNKSYHGEVEGWFAKKYNATTNKGDLFYSYEWYLDFKYIKSSNLSSYTMRRYIEGWGGYDIFSSNDLEGVKWSSAMKSVKRQITGHITRHSGKGSGEFAGSGNVSVENSLIVAYYSDFTRAFGSGQIDTRFEYNLSNEGDGDGTVFITFSDVYKWHPEKTFIIGADHGKLEDAKKGGAADFGVRGYFQMNFSIKNGKTTYGKLEDSFDTRNHLDLEADDYYGLHSSNKCNRVLCI